MNKIIKYLIDFNFFGKKKKPDINVLRMAVRKQKQRYCSQRDEQLFSCTVCTTSTYTPVPPLLPALTACPRFHFWNHQ
jgi:hypothetical protein